MLLLTIPITFSLEPLNRMVEATILILKFLEEAEVNKVCRFKKSRVNREGKMAPVLRSVAEWLLRV